MLMSSSMLQSVLLKFLLAVFVQDKSSFMVHASELQSIGSRFEAFEGQGTLQEIPRIPDGHKQYQFYTLNSKGELQKQWMSLQEVQNLILTYAYEKHNKIKHSLAQQPPYNFHLNNTEGLMKLPTGWKKPDNRSQPSIDEVLANVQKVMSKEITNSLLKDDSRTPTAPQSYAVTETTTSATDGVYGLTIHQAILANLLRGQVGSLKTHSPWGFVNLSPNTKIFGDAFHTTTSNFLDETVTELPVENFIISDDDEKATQAQVEATTSTKDDLEMEPQFFDKNVLGLILDLQSKVFSPSSSEHDENELFKSTTVNPLQRDKHGYVDLPKETVIPSKHTNTREKPSYTVLPVTSLDQLDYSDNQLNFLNTFQTVTLTTPTASEDSILIATTQDSLSETSKKVMSETTQTSKLEPENFTVTLSYPATFIQANSPLNPDFVNNLLKEMNKAGSSTNSDTATEKMNSFKSGASLEFSIYDYNEKLSPSNVLSPSENVQIPPERISMLGETQGKVDEEYSFYDAPIYLEDIPEQVNDLYSDFNPQNPADGSNANFDFPSPNVTNSYHKPEHVASIDNPIHIHPKPTKPLEKVHSSYLEQVDPTQFLPAFNPDLIKGENPLQETPPNNIGIESTIKDLNPDVKNYIDTMNNLSFQIYKKAAKIHRRQNMIMTPLNLISTLSMLQLGARNMTADALSRVLKSDRFLTFNPHLLLKNITETLLGLNSQNHNVGIVNNIFIAKPRKAPYNVDFFSRTMSFFYNGLVEQVPVLSMGHSARDRANEEIRRQTTSTVHNFLKPKASLKVEGPLSVVSSAYFQGDWGLNISQRNLIDMNFIRFPSAERRLIKTVGISKRMKINAGYSKEMDATVAEIPMPSLSREISMVLVMPGQQKSFIANGLMKLEQNMNSNNWSKLLRSLIPHQINFKMPIFSHRNYLNLSGILNQMGLSELFSKSADFSGINGKKNLHLGDVVQLSEFHSCKLHAHSLRSLSRTTSSATGRSVKDVSGRGRTLPSKDTSLFEERRQGSAVNWRSSRQMMRSHNRKEIRDEAFSRSNDNTLAYDRAFFYVLRHNPTGLVLFIGRYLDPETY